jgi:hypothetical protein
MTHLSYKRKKMELLLDDNDKDEEEEEELLRRRMSFPEGNMFLVPTTEASGRSGKNIQSPSSE